MVRPRQARAELTVGVPHRAAGPPTFAARTPPPPRRPLQADNSRGAPSIPVMRAQQDLLREGAVALKQEALAPHPMQTIQANVRAPEWGADVGGEDARSPRPPPVCAPT